MMSSALVTGIAGQDGFYLASELVKSGTRVIGTTRDMGGQLRDWGCCTQKLNWLSGI